MRPVLACSLPSSGGLAPLPSSFCISTGACDEFLDGLPVTFNPNLVDRRHLGAASGDMEFQHQYQHHPQQQQQVCFAAFSGQRRKPPKVIAGRYLLGETIGRGSYGKVGRNLL
ncbi:unnamed protein product [Protopolystoma xenopodis]|uniref:Uncharacterized protein n=1 Tax=Protopolystoma xenopodis TaxID=117903 RepID=A0A3S5CK86_9PLAT|nr:unnamed protein product [Protopolystoma xenopodis]